MDRQKDTVVEAIVEHLIEHGANDIATVFGRAFELAMQIERERFPGAGLYERTATRQGYANCLPRTVPGLDPGIRGLQAQADRHARRHGHG